MEISLSRQKTDRFGFWIYPLSISIIALSLFVTARSLDKPLYLLGLWLSLSLLLILLYLRPTFLEVLLFVFPPLNVLIAGLTGLFVLKMIAVWFLLLLTIWYIKGMTGDWNKNCLRTPYLIPLALYGILLLFSLFLHPMTVVGYYSLPKVVSLIVIYWILVQLLRGQNLERILKAIILGTVIGSLGFFLALGGGSLQQSLSGFAYGLMRPVVLNQNANTWATYPLLGLPLLLSLLVHRRSKWTELVWLIPSALVLSGVAIITMSRSSLLAIAVAILFIMVSHRRARKLLFIGSVAVGAYIFAIKPVVLSFLISILRLKAGLSGRENIWPIVAEVISKHPFFGLGPGWFRQHSFYFTPFMENGLSVSISRFNAHNAYLEMAVDIGVFAPIIVLFILLFFANRSWILWKRLKGKPNFVVLIAICALMVAGFMRSIFEVYFVVPHLYIDQTIFLITLLAIQDQLFYRYYPA